MLKIRFIPRLFAAAFVLFSAACNESEVVRAAQAAAEQTPPGYMIVITQDVDPAGMRDYARVAVPLLLKFKGRLLFATTEGANEQLEGPDFRPSVRVFEFPSVQAARGYYQSETYQSAIPLREGNGQVTVLISDAFVPDPKWTRK